MVSTNIPLIKLGENSGSELQFNFIQGGMGVGISQAGLASAVASEGGTGIIASVGLGALKGYFAELVQTNHYVLHQANSPKEKQLVYDQLYAISNQLALKDEIKIARQKSNGVIGVNIMHALTDYSSLVEAAIEAEADLIISGAGIPRDLPSYLNRKKTKLVPIVSSERVADIICKSWARLKHLPDAIIVEGPMAGGHEGFSYEQLADPEFVFHGLEKILKEVIQVAKKFETSSKKIPVIAAGGIFYGGDIRRAVEDWHVAGVQMATRFVITNECDADIKFKKAYFDCKKEDLRIIKSPVGMPGRAINNEFLQRVARGETIPISCPYHCLKTCIPEKSPYCIGRALSEAQRGKFDNGYVFAGANAWRCKEDGIISVHDLVRKIDEEYRIGKVCD